jgi:D-amino-acid dehydrogenase
MKKVTIIGGGIIGLSTAWYLAQEGHAVEILEASDMEDGCSYGNAGMVVPSHVLPLAQPGMIAQGMRWMFKRKSPFYVHPRLSRELFAWAWQFYRHANAAHVNRSKKALLKLSVLSKELYQEHARHSDFGWKEPGLFMLYQTEKTGEEEREAGEIARELGLEVDFLSAAQFQQMENGLHTEVLGAVHYKSDGLLNPRAFMEFLKADVQAMGVQIRRGVKVQGFARGGQNARILCGDGHTVDADEIVLCAGAWSAKLAAQLGIQVQVLPGKGYSFLRERKEGFPTLPSILCEGKVAVSPYAEHVRFGGTMEITQVRDTRIDLRRVEGITDTVRRFYPEMQFENPEVSEIWYGFRPCTPSGLPLIGRSAAYSNVIVATGHAMMGLSLGPATGKLVSEIVAGRKTSVDLNAFRVK